jgi:chromosome segregation ATPase
VTAAAFKSFVMDVELVIGVQRETDKLFKELESERDQLIEERKLLNEKLGEAIKKLSAANADVKRKETVMKHAVAATLVANKTAVELDEKVKAVERSERGVRGKMGAYESEIAQLRSNVSTLVERNRELEESDALLRKEKREYQSQIDILSKQMKESQTALSDFRSNDVTELYNQLRKKFLSLEDEKEVIENLLKKSELKNTELHKQVALLQRKVQMKTS